MPTKDWILQTADELSRFYRQRDQNILSWRSLYFLDEEAYFVDNEGRFIPSEDDETRVILPIAQATVESFRSLLLARPPVISVPSSSVKEVDQDKADNTEGMLYSLWDRSNVLRAIQDALWHALVDGWGIIQTKFDPSASDKGEVPVYAKALDPIGVWPMPGDRPGSWEYVISSQYELVGTLRRTFIDGKDRRKRKTRVAESALEGMAEDDRVLVLDYWDDEHHAIMVVPHDSKQEAVFIHEGEWLLEPTPHEYGGLPFVIWHGHSMPQRDRGERMGTSVLWPIENLIRYVSKLMSQKATIVARYTAPTLVVKSQDGRGFDMPGMFGGQLPLFPEEDAEYLMPSGPPPQVDVMFEEMLGQIETAGLPRHIMGQLTMGRISGVAMNLLRTPVLMRIAFKEMDIERSLERMNELFLQILENRQDEPIYLWGRDAEGRNVELVLDPGDIEGYYRNHVRLSASLPTDEPSTVAMLSSLAQLGVISKRTYRDIVQQTLRDLSPQSLDQEENQILIEQLLQQEAFQQALMLEAAKESELALLPMIEQMLGGQNQQGSQPALPGMGSESGLSPFNPLQAGQEGSAQNPRAPDLVRRMASNMAGSQGGRPSGPEQSIGLGGGATASGLGLNENA